MMWKHPGSLSLSIFPELFFFFFLTKGKARSGKHSLEISLQRIIRPYISVTPTITFCGHHKHAMYPAAQTEFVNVPSVFAVYGPKPFTIYLEINLLTVVYGQYGTKILLVNNSTMKTVSL